MCKVIIFLLVLLRGFTSINCNETDGYKDENHEGASFEGTCEEDEDCQEFIFNEYNLDDLERNVASFIKSKLSELTNDDCSFNDITMTTTPVTTDETMTINSIPTGAAITTKPVTTAESMTSEQSSTSSPATFVPDAQDCPRTTYHFPNTNQITDYVKFNTTMPDLTNVSICAWITPLPGKNISGSLFSYFTEGSAVGNTILVLFPQNRGHLQIMVNHKKGENVPKFPLVITTKSLLCVFISTETDQVNLYLNGSFVGRRTFNERKTIIPGNGVAIIGQEQDTRGGSFQSQQAFSGTVQNFLFWDRLINETEIEALLATKCICPRDYVMAPTRDVVEIYGNVNATYQDKCSP